MSVLVILEVRGGEVKKAALEALSVGRKITESIGGTLSAVAAGDSLAGAVEAAKRYGAEKVYVHEDASLSHYAPDAWVAAAAEAASQSGAKVILVSATSFGRDLAPRVAAKLGVMILPDVTGLEVEDGTVVATRPVYAGKAYMKIAAKALPVVISARPRVFEAAEAPGAGERVEISPAYEVRSRVVEVEAAGSGKLDVAEADRIVSGGRGMQSPENFALVEQLADLLGAAVGASRAVVDAGWRPHSEQVGQTGKTVSPSLYIALGISGAVQHLAGMRTSKVIVAVNKDADAPIFKLADYGIVGDAMQVVPALIEELKK